MFLFCFFSEESLFLFRGVVSSAARVSCLMIVWLVHWYIPQEYWKRGYEEVTTPNMYNMDLWEQSGHAKHYRDAMFRFPVEGQEFGAYLLFTCVLWPVVVRLLVFFFFL